MNITLFVRLFAFLALLGCTAAKPCAAAEPLKLLFLGDNGHHRPADRFHQLAPVLDQRGILLQYTDDVSALNAETLNEFDGLVLYANIDSISKPQADALLEFVDGGKGFVPLHCATYCFRNDERIVALMGGQFLKHGGEVFTTEIAEPGHPVMKGYGSFTSWDETYVHHKHNPDNRTVLEYRVQGMQADGQDREPWTWVRSHGKGRIFYTAWGHDHRTWSNPGFQNLVERGIRWACGDDPAKAGTVVAQKPFDPPQMTELRKDVAPFEYVDVGPKIPNYTPSRRWGTQGEPFTKMQLPLPPEESIKHYVTPVGFELKLFASEPQLGAKPIAMNWDERGRLWVCETVDYPNELQPENAGSDRIEIVADENGDGVADSFTLFADQLSIPTAILPFDNGCIVQNGTETLYLADTNGDGKADLRQALITGWALNDTHGGVSNFRLGLDNWIYAMQGYNDSTPTIDGKPQQSFRMGFFRFKVSRTPGVRGTPLKVTDVEFLRSTNNNTWGLGISEEGIIFGSTANRCPSVYMPIPNRYYEQVKGWSPNVLEMISDTYLFDPITEKVRQVDQHGGYTAGAGHALYTARNYPQQWWNRTAFVCGPTGHLVGTFVLERDGADFHSTSPVNLVASDDEWAAPIAAEVGPDGNVWILDWYNYIVQHNPTPHGFGTGKGNAYETDLRDKKHGRIYRLVYKGDDSAATATTVSLADASPHQLVDALKNPTMLVRLQAQRLLVERGKTDVVPELSALVRDRSVDEVGLNVGAIHAIWTLHGLGQLGGEGNDSLQAVTEALSHPSAGVRRNAVQALPHNGQTLTTLASSGVLADPDAQVRLAALLALADLPASDEAGTKAAGLALDASVTADRWLGDALVSAGAKHAGSFLSALASAADVSPAVAERVMIVAEHFARSRPDSDTVNRLAQSLTKADGRFVSAVLEGMANGWPRDHAVALEKHTDQALLTLLESAPATAKGHLIRLASLWGSEALEAQAGAIADALLATVGNGQSPPAARIDAAQQLVDFRPDDPHLAGRLLAQITPQLSPDVAAGLIEALSRSNSQATAETLLNKLASMTPANKEVALRVLLSRPQSTRVFLKGAASGLVRLDDLKLDQKQSLANHPESDIRRQARRLLEQGGGLPNPDRQKVVEDFLSLAQQKGDARAGLEMFKKHCMKCHRHGELGENIGPNLTGMAVHPKAELMVHILDPSRSVEGNFRLYTVATLEGRIYSGMLASETRTSIELIDTEGKRHALAREDIDALVASPKSLMPEGFEKQMTREEFSDLLEFLTTKGKYVPLDLRKAATVVTTQGMFFDRQGRTERLIFPDWEPKTFKGVPFVLIDPHGDRTPNAIMLRGRNGNIPPTMPTQVSLPVNAPAKAIHILGGVSGWGFPASQEKSPTLTLRLHYADGTTEDHELRNGVHFADYIRRVDVPESEFAYPLRGQQIRYLSVTPKKTDQVITEIDLIKPDPNDITAPIVMAMTVETP